MKQPDYTGTHWLIEFHGASNLSDPITIEQLLSTAAQAGKAKLLQVNTHHFGGAQGVAGVALLAESHISIHTWPEYRYAAIDVFLCGSNSDPDKVLAVLRDALRPEQETVKKIVRGYSVKS
jgi:S-adenosylmethionine decarboxylase